MSCPLKEAGGKSEKKEGIEKRLKRERKEEKKALKCDRIKAASCIFLDLLENGFYPAPFSLSLFAKRDSRLGGSLAPNPL